MAQSPADKNHRPVKALREDIALSDLAAKREQEQKGKKTHSHTEAWDKERD